MGESTTGCGLMSFLHDFMWRPLCTPALALVAVTPTAEQRGRVRQLRVQVYSLPTRKVLLIVTVDLMVLCICTEASKLVHAHT